MWAAACSTCRKRTPTPRKCWPWYRRPNRSVGCTTRISVTKAAIASGFLRAPAKPSVLAARVGSSPTSVTSRRSVWTCGARPTVCWPSCVRRAHAVVRWWPISIRGPRVAPASVPRSCRVGPRPAVAIRCGCAPPTRHCAPACWPTCAKICDGAVATARCCSLMATRTRRPTSAKRSSRWPPMRASLLWRPPSISCCAASTWAWRASI